MKTSDTVKLFLEMRSQLTPEEVFKFTKAALENNPEFDEVVFEKSVIKKVVDIVDESGRTIWNIIPKGHYDTFVVGFSNCHVWIDEKANNDSSDEYSCMFSLLSAVIAIESIIETRYTQ